MAMLRWRYMTCLTCSHLSDFSDVFLCFQLCQPGYTAALTPVSAPLLWANARQGAAGGGVADLEADRIGAAEPCMVQRCPKGIVFLSFSIVHRSTNSFTAFRLAITHVQSVQSLRFCLIRSNMLEQRMSFEQHSKEARGFPYLLQLDNVPDSLCRALAACVLSLQSDQGLTGFEKASGCFRQEQ